uniref:Uncharacterized protein n=1 Tax=Anguilla anguilla TaxID=7936 RepID=A0A0E9T8Z1_ANGAN
MKMSAFIFPIFTGKKTQQSMGWHQGEQSEEKERVRSSQFTLPGQYKPV